MMTGGYIDRILCYLPFAYISSGGVIVRFSALLLSLGEPATLTFLLSSHSNFSPAHLTSHPCGRKKMVLVSLSLHCVDRGSC